uniref:Uncharacterized protein n=1 Tax=Castor canadensis TaxID=51338 RepID=A0A8C0WCA1_CASCN
MLAYSYVLEEKPKLVYCSSNWGSWYTTVLSIMSYNGGAAIAMKGKNCVTMAANMCFRIQAPMVTIDFQKIFPMSDISLARPAPDIQTVVQCLKFLLNLYELKKCQRISQWHLLRCVSLSGSPTWIQSTCSKPSPKPC